LLTPVPTRVSEPGIFPAAYETFQPLLIGPSRNGEYWKRGDWSVIVKLYSIRFEDILESERKDVKEISNLYAPTLWCLGVCCDMQAAV
jgi:hypothetical protein